MTPPVTVSHTGWETSGARGLEQPLLAGLVGRVGAAVDDGPAAQRQCAGQPAQPGLGGEDGDLGGRHAQLARREDLLLAGGEHPGLLVPHALARRVVELGLAARLVVRDQQPVVGLGVSEELLGQRLLAGHVRTGRGLQEVGDVAGRQRGRAGREHRQLPPAQFTGGPAR
ncbi:hypothetical protein GCM10020000_24490 [Streptomyces olivoverticillatus]